jgi:hypothetical protein
MMLTQARLKELFDYDPGTGIFTWKAPRGSRARIGATAGKAATNGRLQLFVDGSLYQLHRAAWIYMTGPQPEGQIDHINGIRDDNRFSNLRDVTPSENCQNKRTARADSSSGLIGVSPRVDGTWRARIVINGKRISLGSFITAAAAHTAYLESKRQHHPTCTI